MTTALASVSSLSDRALLSHVAALAVRERQATADLVVALCELDARRLYLAAGCSSLFSYCTQVLHLSEHAAYGRIAAARCARRVPQIVERLGDGSLTLTAVCLLAPVISVENAASLLDRARHRCKRDVECLVAEMRPQPGIATMVRKLPPASRRPTPSMHCDNAPTQEGIDTQGESVAAPVQRTAPARPATVRPLAPEAYKVQFTLSGDGYKQLRRAQDLLRHTIRNGDAGAIFERALSMLIDHLEKKKLAATDHPRVPRPLERNSRHIPAAVKREVWRRDKGRCAFVGSDGRCTEHGLLELHHVVPYAEGGEPTAGNVQLRCRAHNQHEAALWFGPDLVKNCNRDRQPQGSRLDQLGLDRVRPAPS
jgi:hypothetical protein